MSARLFASFFLSLIIHAVIATLLAAPMAGLFNLTLQELPPPFEVEVSFLAQKNTFNQKEQQNNVENTLKTINTVQQTSLITDETGLKKQEVFQKAIAQEEPTITIAPQKKLKKLVYKKAPVTNEKSTNVEALTPGTPLLIQNPDWDIKTPPTYPLKAIDLGLQGTVILHLIVSPQGVVTKAIIHSSSGTEALDKAAQKQALHWRMKPKKVGGSAQECIVEVSIPFVLKG